MIIKIMQYLFYGKILFGTRNRGPARTSVNWGVHGNTSCPPSWRAMNQLIYQSPTQIALLHASAVERELKCPFCVMCDGWTPR